MCLSHAELKLVQLAWIAVQGCIGLRDESMTADSCFKNAASKLAPVRLLDQELIRCKSAFWTFRSLLLLGFHGHHYLGFELSVTDFTNCAVGFDNHIPRSRHMYKLVIFLRGAALTGLTTLWRQY
ncbi:hypothetical protein F4779DRAFT_570320 [Xylariaceae sp. FL0662B]|nr:hypothetical protein F4779DRAFT_570320 [Xylariaceae sp. FL0662B]